MNSDGIYKIEYSGVAGSGSGMLVLKNNVVAGGDQVGGKYDGTYKLNGLTNCLDMQADVTIPPGTWAVNGMVAGPQPIVFPVNASIPVNHVGGYQHTVHTPRGNIVVRLTKMRDL
jgi:hypothetical protein